MRGLCHCCWSTNEIITLNKCGLGICEICSDKEKCKCEST